LRYFCLITDKRRDAAYGGTSLLGQLFLIFIATIRQNDSSRYYVLMRQGHGHHSGSTGDLIPEMRTITTAKYIVERIVVGVNETWYKK
jgi:hypothetical protein